MSTADLRPTCPKCHGTGRVAEEARSGGLEMLIAGAEERGRRRGDAERDELRARIGKWGKCEHGFPLAEKCPHSGWPAFQLCGGDIARAALAPRDSGKETLCPECSQPVTLNADGSVPIHARGGRFACALGWPTGDRK